MRDGAINGSFGSVETGYSLSCHRLLKKSIVSEMLKSILYRVSHLKLEKVI